MNWRPWAAATLLALCVPVASASMPATALTGRGQAQARWGPAALILGNNTTADGAIVLAPEGAQAWLGVNGTANLTVGGQGWELGYGPAPISLSFHAVLAQKNNVSDETVTVSASDGGTVEVRTNDTLDLHGWSGLGFPGWEVADAQLVVEFDVGDGTVQVEGNSITSSLSVNAGSGPSANKVVAFPLGTHPPIASLGNLTIHTTPMTFDYQIDEVVLHLNLTPHYASGEYLSAPVDAGEMVAWGNLSWSEAAPASTRAEVYVATSFDNLSWSGWSGPVAQGQLSDPLGPQSRFLRVRAVLSTVDTNLTPSIGGFVVDWTPFSPAYSPQGDVVTDPFFPSGLRSWGAVGVEAAVPAGCAVDLFYDLGSGWTPILPGHTPVGGATPIRLRAVLHSDGNGTPSLIALTLNYTFNHPPTAVGSTFAVTVPEDGSVLVPLASVVEDGDVGDRLNATLDSPYLSAVVEGESLRFTALIPDYTGLAPGTLTVRDIDGDTASIAITGTVSPVNDPPQLLGLPAVRLPQGIAVHSIDLSGAAYDIDDPPATLVWSGLPEQGVTGLAVSPAPGGLAINVTDPLLTGWANLSVTVRDIAGAADSGTLRLFVEPVTEPPRWNLPSWEGATDEDVPLIVDLAPFLNGDGPFEVVVRGADSALLSASSNGTNLSIVPAPNAWGVANLTLVAHGLGSAAIPGRVVVREVDDPPVIAPLPESLLRFQGAMSLPLPPYALDVDDPPENLTWSATGDGVVNATVEGDVLHLRSYPGVEGTGFVVLNLSDGRGGFDERTVSVVVERRTEPPRILGIPDLFVHFDEPYTIDLAPYIDDPDTPDGSLALVARPASNASCTGTNLTVRYGADSAGRLEEVELDVSDGASVTQSRVYVHVGYNNVPVLVRPMGNLTLEEDPPEPVRVRLEDHFEDPDRDRLTYTTLPAEHIVATVHDAVLSISPAEDWFGFEILVVRATDTSGAFVESALRINVTPVNDPPVWTREDADFVLTVNRSTTIDLAPFILDVDTPASRIAVHAVLAYNVTSVDARGAVLSLGPIQQPGTVRIDLAISDGEASVNVSGRLVVLDSIAPVIDSVPDLRVRFGVPYMFSLAPYISDENDPKEDLTVTTDSEYITFDTEENMVMVLFYPTKMDEDVVITVTDPSGLSNATQIHVQASDNYPPEILIPLPDVVFMEDETLSPFCLDDHFTDRDGGIKRYVVTNDTICVTVDPGERHAVVLSAPKDWYGTETVKIQARDREDDEGALVEDTFLVTVLPVNDPPVIDLGPLGTVEAVTGTLRRIDLSAYVSDVDDPQSELRLSSDSPEATPSGLALFVQYDLPGEKMVNVTVSDGEAATTALLTIRVMIPNQAPHALPFRAATTAEAGSVWEVSLDDLFYDPDGDELVYEVTGAQADNGTIRWRPERPGEALTVTVTATDGRANKTTSFTITSVEPKKVPGTEEGGPVSWLLWTLIAGLFALWVGTLLYVRRKRPAAAADRVAQGGDGADAQGGGIGSEYGSGPAADEVVSPDEVAGKLQTGRSYLIPTNGRIEAPKVFAFLTLSHPSLCLTRVPPSRMRREYGLSEEVRLVWLSRSKEGHSISPTDVEVMYHEINEFVTLNPGGVVLLDGLEYLTVHNTFAKLIKLINEVDDLMALHDAMLIVPVDPNAMSPENYALLQRDMVLLDEESLEDESGVEG